MRMSSRMSAKSVLRICLSASFPDPAASTFRSGPERSCCMASRPCRSSSTTRMLACDESDTAVSDLLGESDPQERQKLFDIDGLGDIVGSAGFEAFLAIPFHRFRSHCDDRKIPEFL